MMDRYLRQTILPEIGEAGQRKLAHASVLCVGAGGLGSPASLYLVAAGVGRVGLMDPDEVDESNLQRQILFLEEDQGKSKVLCAKERLQSLNSQVQIEALPERLTARNALSVFSQYDVILDGTDNFAAKYLINDAALRAGKPVVYGSISRMEGQLSVFGAPGGPCYRCLYPLPPKVAISNCAESGVLGAVAGVIGSLQCVEALKWIVGLPGLQGRLWVWDALSMRARTLRIEPRPDCPVCSGPRDSIELVDLSSECDLGLLAPPVVPIVSALDLQKLLAEKRVELLDVREEEEWASGHLPEARHFPLSWIRQGKQPALDPSCEIVLYCQSGVRSREACERLLNLEPELTGRLFSLKNGLLHWPE